MTVQQGPAGGRVVLVTGTSGGIGDAVRSRLLRDGWTVYGTSRRADGRDPFVLPLDVTDDESVRTAVATVLERSGRIDAVVINAGVDISGAVEETTVEEAKALFDTNFFGVHQVTRAVLPHLRRSGAGRVLVVGSLAGLVPVPFDAIYTASKHALEGWIDALQVEVAPFGVRCTIVEPGFVRTRFDANRTPVQERLEVYAATRTRTEASLTRSFDRGVPPERVAEVVGAVLHMRRPPLHRSVGREARAVVAARRFLPAPMFEAGLRRRF